MSTKIVIDPVSRIEGHLKIEAIVENGTVKEARSSGMLFRGLEIILRGRDPRDAQRITQRICGVCPTAHASASSLALDEAFGIAGKIPNNGRIVRNLIQGANYIQSHILHFYHLTALDYVDVTAVAGYKGTDQSLNMVKSFISRGELAPFVPRYEGDYRLSTELNRAAVAHYVEALNKRRAAQEMLCIFGGHMPHNMAMVPGGVTEQVTVDKIANFYWKLQTLRNFIDNVYIPDVLAVAEVYADYFEIGAGCGQYLAYGGLDLDSQPDLTKRARFLAQGTVSAQDLAYQPLDPTKIREDVKYSWFESQSGLHPSKGQTEANPIKAGAYSWVKAPRYNGKPYEVGPLARTLVAYTRQEPKVREWVTTILSHFKAQPKALFSVLGRHAARAIECKLVADAMAEWLLELKPGEPTCAEYTIPEKGEGMGLWEGPRGALGHWIEINDHVIANYQAVVPTTWNCSPRDDQGQPGPVEQALEGTRVKDKDNPFELVRIVRSFDPCLACAVHVITPRGTEIARFKVG
jgi:hydrogenase large subunit